MKKIQRNEKLQNFYFPMQKVNLFDNQIVTYLWVK